jgi:hypothetical protein
MTLALIARFEVEIVEAAKIAAVASDGKDLRTSLKLLIGGLLRVHEGRANLNRILETEENRLHPASSEASAARHLKKLIASLLAQHAGELGTRVDGVEIDDIIVITRAMVDDALQKDVSHPAASRRILRAIEGYLRWK